MKNLTIRLIKWYRRKVSPKLPAMCRFNPTCSKYALEAINKYGLITGGFISFKRFCRCNPFSKGGYDPVP